MIISDRPAASHSDIAHRLMSLGYLEEGQALADAVKRFQQFNGLKVDGVAGPKTERLLIYTPRCGCPDIQRAGICKWPMRDVAYWHNLSFSGMSVSDVKRAFKDGAEKWNEVCGINLHPVDDIQEANIYAHAKAIDARGGTLAWSFLPCGASSTTRLEQRYDTREQWSYSFLRRVVMHEIGHAIGFDHNSQRSSIMYAYSNPEVNDPNASDIHGAIQRYGEARPVPPKPDPPKPEPPQPEPPSGGVTVSGELTINGKPYILAPKPDFTLI